MQTRRVPRKANNRLPPRKEDRPLLAAAWPAAVLGRALALASGSGGGGRAGRPVPGLRALAHPPVPPSCLLLPACLFLCFLIPTGARVVSFSYCVVANPWAALLRVAFSFVPFRWVFSLGVPGTQTTRWRFTGTDGIVALGQDREAEGPEHQVQLRTQGTAPHPGGCGWARPCRDRLTQERRGPLRPWSCPRRPAPPCWDPLPAPVPPHGGPSPYGCISATAGLGSPSHTRGGARLAGGRFGSRNLR